ncbi:MAG: hypothetical protein ACK4NB_01670 [Fimbriimonadales bacterium]
MATQQRFSGARFSEWSQHTHDAQRTGYTAQIVPPPWRLRWIWNGVDAQGDPAMYADSPEQIQRG